MHIAACGPRILSEYDGHFEIVSITGTVSIHGSHLHISISDGDGKTIGGHLDSGCKIYTTAEIVMAVFNDVIYKREFAEDSGYENWWFRSLGASLSCPALTRLKNSS